MFINQTGWLCDVIGMFSNRYTVYAVYAMYRLSFIIPGIKYRIANAHNTLSYLTIIICKFNDLLTITTSNVAMTSDLSYNM